MQAATCAEAAEMNYRAIDIAPLNDAAAHEAHDRAQRRWQTGAAKANPDITTPLLEDTDAPLHEQKPAVRLRAVAGAACEMRSHNLCIRVCESIAIAALAS